jgi:hypothetical protein
MRLHHGNLLRGVVNCSAWSAESTPKLFQAKICAKYYLKNELTFTKTEQSNQKRRTETIFCRKLFKKLFVLPLRVLWKWSKVAVCGCGDMEFSAVLSKLQMLFVAFMGQIPSSWLLKHSLHSVGSFWFSFYLEVTRFTSFKNLFWQEIKDIVRWFRYVYSTSKKVCGIFYSSLQANKVFGKNWMRIDQNWTYVKKLDVKLEILQLKLHQNCMLCPFLKFLLVCSQWVYSK